MNCRNAVAHFVSIGILFVATLAVAVTELPAPTGPYAVGRTLMYTKDDSRPENWTDDPKDRRELVLMVWYPADAGSIAPVADYSPYPPDKIRGRLAIERGRGRVLTIHTRADLALAAGTERFPVILFSGGSGASPSSYHALIEDLVSHGYIVVGMDHLYEGAGQVMADGRLIESITESFKPAGDPQSAAYAEASRAYYFRRVDERAKDAAMTVPLLKMMNGGKGRFAGRIDLDRIGVLGHSLGGVAAAHALAEVPALKAGVNLDGHARSMPFDDKHVPTKPFLMVEAPTFRPSDETLVRWKMTREAYETMERDALERQKAAYSSNPTASYCVTINGADHGNFSDEVYPMQEKDIDGRPDRVQITTVTRLYLLAFFDKWLRGVDAPALNAVPAEFAGFTTVEKFGGSK